MESSLREMATHNVLTHISVARIPKLAFQFSLKSIKITNVPSPFFEWLEVAYTVLI